MLKACCTSGSESLLLWIDAVTRIGRRGEDADVGLTTKRLGCCRRPWSGSMRTWGCRDVEDSCEDVLESSLARMMSPRPGTCGRKMGSK